MSLCQIRYFVAIAEEGNMGRAAQRLNISQPPLSRHMRDLELELGTTLFERTPRGMTLLAPGERFLTRARRVLAEVELATREAQQEYAALKDAPSPPTRPRKALRRGPCT